GLGAEEAGRGEPLLVAPPAAPRGLELVGERRRRLDAGGAVGRDAEGVAADHRQVVRQARVGDAVVPLGQAVLAGELVGERGLGAAAGGGGTAPWAARPPAVRTSRSVGIGRPSEPTSTTPKRTG